MSPTSSINARELSHALLNEIEARGTNASGFAWAKRDGSNGMFKRDIRASQLKLEGMPKNADTVILHSRMATHGRPEVNANNHPVVSPSGRIRLVHNGVLYNHDDVRDILTRGKELPEVDTSVLPAAIEEYGIDGTGVIAGDAAAAWLDQETGNTLHLAKFQSSPVAIARLLDGSVVYASTEKILAQALIAMGLKWIGGWPDTFLEMQKGDYYQITDSDIQKQADVDWFDDYFYTGKNWRDVTSGAKNAYGQTVRAIEAPQFSKGSEADRAWRESWEFDDEEYPGHFDTDGQWVFDDEDIDAPMSLLKSSDEDLFYTTDYDGDYLGYKTLESLVNSLKWQAALTGAENVLVADGPERWVNHFVDVGEVLSDGASQSWVRDPSWMEDHDANRPEGIGFIKDGVEILSHIMATR